MTRYMLDTDTASYVIKGGYSALDRRLAAMPPAEVCISTVSRAELLYGVPRKSGAHHLARRVEQFLARVRSVAWDDAAADQFGRIAAALDAVGQPIGTFDTLIAAHAVAQGSILVTNNTAHFRRVPGLAVENWVSKS